jgi:hypothetical protein
MRAAPCGDPGLVGPFMVPSRGVLSISVGGLHEEALS